MRVVVLVQRLLVVVPPSFSKKPSPVLQVSSSFPIASCRLVIAASMRPRTSSCCTCPGP